MKFSTAAGLASICAVAAAAASSDVAFLTALVSDFEDNKKEYVQFLVTADDVPAGLTELAVEVGTYTDDSYTTLLDDSDINVTELRSFATELPWYSRIAAAVGGSVAGSASGSGSTSGSSTSTGSSSSSGADASTYAASAGAFLGAVALILM